MQKIRNLKTKIYSSMYNIILAKQSYHCFRGCLALYVLGMEFQFYFSMLCYLLTQILVYLICTGLIVIPFDVDLVIV